MRRLLGGRSIYCQPSYAQEGEDRMLSALLGFPERTTTGFYIDVGAHHPERFSNTFLFYSKGWSGINIDAMPGSMKPFHHERPRDINIEAAIAEEANALTFYEFNEPALNGFCREIASARDQYRNWKIIRERKITTIRLETLLGQYLPVGQVIDFMSVDVEGLDFEVLKSNDWNRFRPGILLVEDSEAIRIDQCENSNVTNYLKKQGYVFCCKTLLTTFFGDKDKIAITPMGIRLKYV